jgi:hypothetical protein
MRQRWIQGACVLGFAGMVSCGGDKDGPEYTYTTGSTPGTETEDSGGPRAPGPFYVAWMGGPYITVAVSHDDGNGVPSISTAGDEIAIQLSMYFASAEWWDSPGDGPVCNMLIRTYSELEPLEGGWLDTDRAEDHDGGPIVLAYELKDLEIVDGCSGEIEDPAYANLASDMLNHWWSIGIHELSTVETEWYTDNRDDFEEGYAVGIGWTTDAIDNYMPYGWAYA